MKNTKEKKKKKTSQIFKIAAFDSIRQFYTSILAFCPLHDTEQLVD
jgi:hypothetical protein